MVVVSHHVLWFVVVVVAVAVAVVVAVVVVVVVVMGNHRVDGFFDSLKLDLKKSTNKSRKISAVWGPQSKLQKYLPQKARVIFQQSLGGGFKYSLFSFLLWGRFPF